VADVTPCVRSAPGWPLLLHAVAVPAPDLTAPAPGNRPADDVVDLARELPVFGALARVARRAIRRAAGLPVLPEAQVEVLRVVEASPGLGTGAVAERLQLVPNTVSTLVGELVTEGLIVRERDTSDRRIARLRLTPAAVDRLRQWGEVRDQVVTGALERLSPEDRAALAAAVPAARRLLAVLEEPTSDTAAPPPSSV